MVITVYNLQELYSQLECGQKVEAICEKRKKKKALIEMAIPWYKS